MSMKYSKEHWQRQLDEVMDYFNFERVHKCMTLMKWTWDSGGIQRIPDLPEIRQEARRLLSDCIKINREISTGGFRASIDKKEGILSLEFIVEDWTTNVD